jgi:proline dehydrogenase
MVDAEQSYFQPAIDYLAVDMMRKYNRDLQTTQPPVFNTYQMYLKDGQDRLLSDMQLAERVNSDAGGKDAHFMFAVKLVRGAYMTTERARAHSLQIKDPIQHTHADTNHAYDSAVEKILLKAASPSINRTPLALIIASHNRESVIQACEKMQALSLPNHGSIKFAQLYGMHDHLSFTLTHNGYEVCKYIPYGPVEDVIPYLLRRAQENRSVLVQGRTGNDDRSLLWRELKRRLFGDFRKTGGIPDGLEGYIKTVDD